MNEQKAEVFPLSKDLVTGPCCACGRVVQHLRNVILIPYRVPALGGERVGGWGCAVCHLPCEGAVAFVCDPCLEADLPLKTFVLGDPRDGRRGRVEDLSEAWRHDFAFHPETRRT